MNTIYILILISLLFYLKYSLYVYTRWLSRQKWSKLKYYIYDYKCNFDRKLLKLLYGNKINSRNVILQTTSYPASDIILCLNLLKQRVNDQFDKYKNFKFLKDQKIETGWFFLIKTLIIFFDKFLHFNIYSSVVDH